MAMTTELKRAVERKRRHRTKPKRASRVQLRHVSYMRDCATIVNVKQDWDAHEHEVWLTREQAINVARRILRKYEVK